MTAAEKKISAFCARHRFRYSWQSLKFDGCRAVIPSMDRISHAETLKAARRLKGVRVTEWVARSQVFEGRIYLQDAADAERIASIQEAEQERNDAWWNANHSARLSGMDPTAAARYAETLYPTPATV